MLRSSLVFKEGNNVASFNAEYFKKKKIPYIIEMNKGLLNIKHSTNKVAQLKLYNSSHEIELANNKEKENAQKK